tara:strand:- start:1521 stop:2429 length:909 start_codon:yes stop_codon:yes gene_type:complete
MTSIVFPGQGSQFIGMAKDFHDNFELAKKIFEEMEDYSKIDLRKIIFENQENKLNITRFTQICIFACSYVIFKISLQESDISFNDIKVMMGHSLGEYTALACSNKISLKDCSIILKNRGELMNSAIKPNETGMAALIGGDSIYVQQIIDENDLNLEIANDNSPMQIVISGKKEEIEKNKNLFLSSKIKKFIELNVSAAFHSKYMLQAQQKLSEEINLLKFFENEIKIISNYDAQAYNDTTSIKKNLQHQMANKVNWTQSVIKLEEMGENKIIEIGPNKVLSGLINRISRNFDIKSINQISDL